MKAFAGTTFAAYSRLRLVHLLEERILRRLFCRHLVPGLEEVDQDRGGVRRITVPYLVRISSIASAFCFCHRMPQRTKVSKTAARTASAAAG